MTIFFWLPSAHRLRCLRTSFMTVSSGKLSKKQEKNDISTRLHMSHLWHFSESLVSASFCSAIWQYMQYAPICPLSPGHQISQFLARTSPGYPGFQRLLGQWMTLHLGGKLLAPLERTSPVSQLSFNTTSTNAAMNGKARGCWQRVPLVGSGAFNMTSFKICKGL